MGYIFNFNFIIMQLKDQFLPIVYRIAPDKENEKRANRCLEISENFAIGFAEWLFNGTKPDIKELLEIYKKTL